MSADAPKSKVDWRRDAREAMLFVWYLPQR
jgi:hypothetical protein